MGGFIEKDRCKEEEAKARMVRIKSGDGQTKRDLSRLLPYVQCAAAVRLQREVM